LPSLKEAKSLEDGAHTSINEHGVRADKFTLKAGLAILQEELDDFDQVLVEFVEGLRLSVRARPSGDVPHIEARIGVTLNNGGVTAHGYPQGWQPSGE
jgi:hypothetical protein